MNKLDRADLEQEGLEQEALRWLSRMTSGAATDADRDALIRWRARSADHERAFQSALTLWKQLGHAARTPAAPARLARAPSRRRFLKAGAIAAGVGGVAVAGAKLGFWPGLDGMLADYHTVTGEQRRVALNQQVDVDLNTRSALSLNTGAGEENLTLSSGEAVFTVRDRGRLVVAAADGLVAAERAVFAVHRDGAQIRIACLEGIVDLLEPAPLRLRPLERVVCSGKNLGSVSRADDADAVDGWRRGRLVFRNEPLENVVAELNRYRKGLIVVASRPVAQRLVTGVFNLASLDEALDHIQQALRVPIHRFSPYFVVLG